MLKTPTQQEQRMKGASQLSDRSLPRPQTGVTMTRCLLRRNKYRAAAMRVLGNRARLQDQGLGISSGESSTRWKKGKSELIYAICSCQNFFSFETRLKKSVSGPTLLFKCTIREGRKKKGKRIRSLVHEIHQIDKSEI